MSETSDQLISETAMLDKFDQLSPASSFSVVYERNSNESMPMSDEPSPASSYNIMSPENPILNDLRYTGVSYNASSPLSTVSNGMNCASPQSSIDETQVLSPEQEASIPVVVLDEISQNSPMLAGNQNGFATATNTSFNPAQSGNLAFNQSPQPINLPEQHPTLTNLLRNPGQLEDLRKKIMEKNNAAHGDGNVSMNNQIDLNSVQKELTQMEISNLARTLAESYPGDSQPQMTFAPMNYSTNFEPQEVEVPTESQIEVNDGEFIIDSSHFNLDSNANNLSEQLQQMVTDPEQAQNFGTLYNVLNELMSTNS